MSEEWTGDDTAYRPGGLPQPDLAKVGEIGVWGGEPAQTPVAQVQVAEDYYPHVVWMEWVNPVDLDQKFLYTAPPQREWQGLTDEEVHEAFCHVEYETFNDWKQNPESWCLEFFRHIEAKLKEKNTWTCKN